MTVTLKMLKLIDQYAHVASIREALEDIDTRIPPWPQQGGKRLKSVATNRRLARVDRDVSSSDENQDVFSDFQINRESNEETSTVSEDTLEWRTITSAEPDPTDSIISSTRYEVGPPNSNYSLDSRHNLSPVLSAEAVSPGTSPTRDSSKYYKTISSESVKSDFITTEDSSSFSPRGRQRQTVWARDARMRTLYTEEETPKTHKSIDSTQPMSFSEYDTHVGRRPHSPLLKTFHSDLPSEKKSNDARGSVGKRLSVSMSSVRTSPKVKLVRYSLVEPTQLSSPDVTRTYGLGHSDTLTTSHGDTEAVEASMSTNLSDSEESKAGEPDKSPVKRLVRYSDSSVGSAIKTGKNSRMIGKDLVSNKDLSDSEVSFTPPNATHLSVSTRKISDVPTRKISDVPTRKISDAPTGEISDVPTGEISDVPTGEISDVPTGEIPDVPTGEISDVPTRTISDVPTGEISDVPTGEISDVQTAPSVPDSHTQQGDGDTPRWPKRRQLQKKAANALDFSLAAGAHPKHRGKRKPKGKSRFSVSDPELSSMSASLKHYAETTTSEKTGKPTRRKYTTLGGFTFYKSPKLIKPDPGEAPGLRRSKRTRVPRLRRYADEKVIYKLDPATNTQYIVGIDHKDPEDDILLTGRSNMLWAHIKTKKTTKNVKKKKKKETTLFVDSDVSATDGEIPIYNTDQDEMMMEVVTTTAQKICFYNMDGTIADDDAPIKVAMVAHDETTNCTSGRLYLSAFAHKPVSRSTSNSVWFQMVEGSVIVTYNDKDKKLLKAGENFRVPCGNSYSLKNPGKETCILSYFTIARV